MNFVTKQLSQPKRVCVRLKELREKKGVGLDEIVKKTKIDKRLLLALERCDFDSLPNGLIYQKNFLKKYLKALDEDSEPFIEQMMAEEVVSESLDLKERETKKKYLHWYYFSRFSSIFRYLGFTVLVFILIFYLGWQVKKVIEPPQLTLYSPQNGYIVNQPSVEIQGITEKEAQIWVNGKEIRNNDQGQFSEIVDLTPGLNTIVVSAEKKHGKKTSETRYVVLK